MAYKVYDKADDLDTWGVIARALIDQDRRNASYKTSPATATSAPALQYRGVPITQPAAVLRANPATVAQHVEEALHTVMLREYKQGLAATDVETYVSAVERVLDMVAASCCRELRAYDDSDDGIRMGVSGASLEAFPRYFVHFMKEQQRSQDAAPQEITQPHVPYYGRVAGGIIGAVVGAAATMPWIVPQPVLTSMSSSFGAFMGLALGYHFDYVTFVRKTNHTTDSLPPYRAAYRRTVKEAFTPKRMKLPQRVRHAAIKRVRKIVA